MAHDLPGAVRAAITTIAAGLKLGEVRARAAQISSDYRAGRPSSGAVVSETDIAAYLIARLPATYAAVAAALAELQRLRPGFSPDSLLDVGCGPGTASLAALDRFGRLSVVTALDHGAGFLGTAERLLDLSGLACGVEARFLRADFRALPEVRADLVILAYGLVEVAEGDAEAIARAAFQRASGALVLVEPGSRAGFARIRAAREALVAAGATVLAPCPHQATCPMVEPDWCHFSVRLARSREHLVVKGAEVPFEDEKFSYLIAVRGGEAPMGRRIIAPARHGKAGHQFRVCGSDGIAEMTIGPRDPAFKAAKKLDWGDLF